MKFQHLIFGIVWLSSSGFGSALTLGSVRGHALIGQPLNVTVSVQADLTEDITALCWSADLLGAETRQKISQTRVSVETNGPTAATLVRIVSATPIEEPIVTLNLSAGCQQKTTHHYVLLADLPAPTSLPTPPPDSLAPIKTLAPKKLPAPRQKNLSQPSTPATTPRTAAHSTQARLQLEALGELSDRVADVTLPMTFAPTEDTLHQAQVLAALQQEIITLRTLEARNEASITSLKHRLQVLESRRDQNESSYIGLLWLGALALLGGAAWYWQQRRASIPNLDNAWWRSLKTAPSTPAPTTQPETTETPAAPPDSNPPGPTPPTSTDACATQEQFPKPLTDFGPVSPLDIDLRELHELSESNFNQFIEPQAAPVTLTRPAPHLSLEALFDIRQQADFFISLGQPNQAIELLKKSTQKGEEYNPFIYLDLLGIFHAHALRAEFELLRDDCNLLFNVKVPEFALFDAPGRDLLDYPELLPGLCAAWNKPEILHVLEPLIFRDPWDATKGQTVDLAAFRDLLWLHQVTQTLSHKPRANDDKPWAMSAPSVLS